MTQPTLTRGQVAAVAATLGFNAVLFFAVPMISVAVVQILYPDFTLPILTEVVLFDGWPTRCPAVMSITLLSIGLVVRNRWNRRALVLAGAVTACAAGVYLAAAALPLFSVAYP